MVPAHPLAALIQAVPKNEDKRWTFLNQLCPPETLEEHYDKQVLHNILQQINFGPNGRLRAVCTWNSHTLGWLPYQPAR